MYDGSIPSSEPTPFAVGYGNGYGYESAPAAAAIPATVGAAVAPRWGEGATTMAMPAIDPDATQAITVAVPVAASAPAPYTARPVGAAHPRRRFGRGLVLAGLALVVTGTGIGVVALGSPTELRPAAAITASPGRPAAAATADAAGNLIGRGVDPTRSPGAESLPPVSIIEPTVVTRPATSVPPTTAPHAEVPDTVPPTTPPTTAPTYPPPTTTPPTTAPPMETSPATGPTFTALSVPSTVDCPSAYADAYASFSWTAPGATKVTLSIDGPGIYRSYVGPSGSETVFFPCSSSHTYLFTAYSADGSTTLQSYTVSPA